jgi:hypothetical protein
MNRFQVVGSFITQFSVLTWDESVVSVGMLRPDVSSWKSCHETEHLDGTLSGDQSPGTPIDDVYYGSQRL